MKLKGNKIFIEIEEKEIKELLKEGVIYESKIGEFRFLENTDNLFIKLNIQKPLFNKGNIKVEGGLKK